MSATVRRPVSREAEFWGLDTIGGLDHNVKIGKAGTMRSTGTSRQASVVFRTFHWNQNSKGDCALLA